MPASSRVRLILMLLTLVLTLAGCAGVGSSEPATTSTTPATDSTTNTSRSSEPTTTLGATTSEAAAEDVSQDQLIGSWLLSSGYVVTFSQDGSWEVADPESLDEPFDGGSYEVGDSTLTVVTTEDFGGGCDTSTEGAFELSPGETQDEIQMTSLGDVCANRRNDFVRGLTRYEP